MTGASTEVRKTSAIIFNTFLFMPAPRKPGIFHSYPALTCLLVRRWSIAGPTSTPDIQLVYQDPSIAAFTMDSIQLGQNVRLVKITLRTNAPPSATGAPPDGTAAAAPALLELHRRDVRGGRMLAESSEPP